MSAQIETRSLSCPLSDEDFKLRAHSLAVTRQKLRQVQDDKKSAMKKFSAELADLDAQIDHLAGVVKARAEHRPVSVEWVRDDKNGMMRLVRLDTETEIDSKPMTMAERQATLNFNKKNGAPPADAKPAEAKAKKNGKAAKAAAPETTPAA